MKQHYPKLIFAFLVIVLFYTWRYYAAPQPVAGQLVLHFLDVGQGDATLIQTPENKLILVDGGPDGKVLMSKLSPFFLDGRCRLEAIILTHPDTDHEAGLLEALQRCEIKTVIANTATCTSFNCQEFEKVGGAALNRVIGVMGDIFKVGGVALSVLNPPAYQDFNDANTNDDSIVLLLSYGGYKALLAGDAENKTFVRIFSEDRGQNTEKRIRNEKTEVGSNLSSSISSQPLSSVISPLTSPINLLKVPHHGSANNFDPTVWEQLRPEVAIISVGKNNYGQPSDKVLGEAVVLGTKILRTDEVGSITVTVSNNGSYWVLGSSPRMTR